jgi:hypothetical protein
LARWPSLPHHIENENRGCSSSSGSKQNKTTNFDPEGEPKKISVLGALISHDPKFPTHGLAEKLMSKNSQFFFENLKLHLAGLVGISACYRTCPLVFPILS